MTGYGAAASEGVLRKVADTCLGRRQTLAHAAIRFGELLATGDLRDHDKVERLLVHAGVGLGKTEDDVRRIVAWGMRKGFVDGPPARDRQRVRSRNDAIALVFDQMELASQADWSGRTGATRYRVLVAFHLKAILHGRVEFYASLDHLAELAGVGRSTVHRHMPTFEGSWLRTVEVGSRRDGIATTYRVVRRTTVQSWDTGSPSGGAKGCVPGVHTPAVPVPHHPIMRPDHPVWRGYSKAFRIYLTLAGADGPMSVSDLAAAAGCARRTVYNNRPLLERHALVVIGDDGWSAVPPDEVGEVEVADLTAERRRKDADARRALERRSRTEAAS